MRWPLLLALILATCAGCANTPATTAATTAAPASAAATSAAPAVGATSDRPLVILVSIDGFRPDYLDRGDTPTLAALAGAGVRAKSMQPAFPTLTFPNHYTLVTGLYPDHHGIINNRFRDPASGAAFVFKDRDTTADPSWWGGEPIWITAQKQGLRTATMFWPGSDVAITGVRPDHWLYFDGSMTSDERVDHLLQWIDLPAARRPQFYTLYFDTVDHASHSHGPQSREVDAALREVDTAIARLVAGLRQRDLYRHTDLVIVSDHGGAQTSKALRTYLDEVVPLDDVKVDNYGVLATLSPRPGKTASVERALLKPHPHMQCWRKAQLPARLHYGSNPRLPAIVCVANTGGLITDRAYEQKRRFFSAGEHGYDNADPQMQALFIAHGPDFRSGLVVDAFPNVDVYPLLAHLLRITPAANDGDFATVAPMLRGARR